MERIIVKNLTKNFRIGSKRNQTTSEKIISVLTGKETKRKFCALNNISFSLKEGEILGIIGKNGSGKSTLLRIIAGVYKKDFGEVKVRGKLLPLIGLGFGIKGNLTMRENIFLGASYFGLNRKETKEIFNSIVNFSDLKDFINTKVYQFSSGMKTRLAFSIAIHCKSDILLLDEIFAVGDENFRRKGIERLKEFVKKGGSIIFVAHSLGMVREHCHRVLWMEKGRIIKEGDPKEIVREYQEQK